MDKLVEDLINLGFTRVESEVYITLYKNGRMNGYGIAKKLNRTRPSVYNALDNLLDKGFINSVRESNSLAYVAVNPDLLLQDISQKVTDAAEDAKKTFRELAISSVQAHFENITGRENLIATVNRLIKSAKKEIVMNSSMPLEPFKDALVIASEKNVRIILFSWQNLDTFGLPVEYYSGYDGNDYCGEERIFLVSDLCHCVIGSNDTSAFIPYMHRTEKLPNGEHDFMGMTSSNRLIVNMVTEHIHFDIYLNKMKKKYKKSMVTPDILLGSLMEKGI